MNKTNQNNMSDSALVGEIVGGSREAFATLVTRHQGVVWGVAYGLSCNEGIAEDVAQETFLIAWSSIANLEKPDRVRAWLCGIARNLARKARIRQTGDEYLEDEHESDQAGPEAKLSLAQSSAALRDSLDELAPEYRETLSLFYFADRSIREVASSQEVSEDLVRQRLSRGRKQLRSSVEDRLATTAEKLRPGAVFAAAVMASLASAGTASAASAVEEAAQQGASAELATATKMTAAKFALVALAALLIFGIGSRSWRGADTEQPVAAKGVTSNRVSGTVPAGAAGAASETLPSETFQSYGEEPRGASRLQGLVLDVKGKALSDAQVTISSVPLRSVHTDDEGRFEIEGLLEQRYTLVAKQESMGSEPAQCRAGLGIVCVVVVQPTTVVEFEVTDMLTGAPLPGATATETFYDVMTGTEVDGVIRVTGVSRAWPDFRVEAEGYETKTISLPAYAGANERHHISLRAGEPYEGQVVDEHAQPIAGALVTAMVSSEAIGLNRRAGQTHSGADGHFSFSGLAPGSYRFRVLHDDYLSAVTGIHDGDEGDIIVPLLRGGVLRGRVKAGSEAVHGVRVQVVDIGGHESLPMTYTDSTGAFEVRGLPGGKIRVIAGSGARTVSVETEIADAGTSEVELALEGRAEIIKGVVVDVDGIAVPVARVHLRCGGLGGSTITNADAEGRFTSPARKKGSCFVYATRRGQDKWRFLTMGTDFEVPVQTGRENRVPLIATGILRGRVEDASGRPIKSLAIDSVLAGIEIETQNGHFRVNDFPVGEHRLTFNTKGQYIQERQVEVKLGENDLGAIVAEAPLTVRGTVVNAAGHPISGADVHVGAFAGDGRTLTGPIMFGWQSRYGGNATARSNAAGEFEIRFSSKVKEHMLRIAGEHQIHGRSHLQILSGSGEEKVVLTLLETGALRGKVRGLEGASEYRVIAVHKQSRARFGVSLGDDGEYQFDRLTEGAYELTIEREQERRELDEIEIIAGQRTQSEVEMTFESGSLQLRLESCDEEKTYFVTMSTDKLVPTDSAFAAGPKAIRKPLDGCHAKVTGLEPGHYSVCAWSMDRDKLRANETSFEALGARCSEIDIGLSKTDLSL